MKVFIPYFSGNFQYNVLVGKTFRSALSDLYLPSIKIKTIRDSFASFSYVSLFTPLLWPSYFFHYAARFLSEAGTRWDMGMHYNAEIAPIYSLSMMLVLQKLRDKKKLIAIIAATLFVSNALYMNYFKLKRPFFMGINPAAVPLPVSTVKLVFRIANISGSVIINEEITSADKVQSIFDANIKTAQYLVGLIVEKTR